MNFNELYTALKRMRELSKANVPFSFSFISYNQTDGKSKGLIEVSKATLRTGFSNEQSDKSNILIGYTDLSTGKHGWFYLPLLISLNQKEIK